MRVRSPVGGRGAPRVGVPPWLPDGAGSVRGVSRRGGVSPLPRFRPRPLSGYLATASRRVGLKTPGGSPFRPRGRGDGGARRGPSRRLPRTPVPEAARRRRGGLGAPLGRPWGSPPRARFAGASSVAGPVSVGPDPLPSVVLSLVSLAGPRRTPLRFPRRLSGGGGWRGDRAAVSTFFSGRKKTFVRLLAVDHSARASMKNAASCEN